MSKSIVVYLPEGFADWEGAFLLPELRHTKRPMIIASPEGSPVRSIGGLSVTPEKSIKEIDPKNIEALILIGSDTWMDAEQNKEVLSLAKTLLKEGVLVAAICGATAALAREGVLNDRPHTSNDLDFLKRAVPTYQGEKHYKKQLAVRDGNLITAPGIAPLEFTREVMNHLKVGSAEYSHHWFELFKKGTPPPAEFWDEAP